MIIHFSPKRGAGYLRRTRRLLREEFKNNKSCVYRNYHNSEVFKHELDQLKDESGVVVITAHGSKASIIEPLKLEERGKYAGKWKKVFDIDDTVYFRNKVVATLSCETAEILGIKAVQNGAISYLGFNTQITETLRIVHKNNDVKFLSYSDRLLTLSRKIVANSFFYSIKDFLYKCNSTELLWKDFCFFIEDSVSELYLMDRNDINDKYGIGFRKSDEIFLRDSFIILQAKAKDLVDSIVLIGEENYIPYFFLDKQSPDRLKKIVEINSRYEDDRSLFYKYFVDCICYKLLNMESDFNRAKELLKSIGDSQSLSFDLEALLVRVLCN